MLRRDDPCCLKTHLQHLQRVGVLYWAQGVPIIDIEVLCRGCAGVGEPGQTVNLVTMSE